jgi:AcrR family transcriptional regulator
MSVSTQPRSPVSPEWTLQSLGRSVPRSLRHARDLTTARRIVSTAEGIFAGQGLAGARMDEIARTAKVNKALLYYYFQSKEDLYRFVLETLLSQLRERIGPQATGPISPGKRLAAVIDNFFDFVERHPNYPRLIQREMMGGPNMEWIVSEYYRPLHGQLVGLIEEGISAGEFRCVDTTNTAFNVISIMVFYFAAAPVLSLVLGHDPLQPREVAKRRKAVHDFLEHGLFRPGAGRR